MLTDSADRQPAKLASYRIKPLHTRRIRMSGPARHPAVGATHVRDVDPGVTTADEPDVFLDEITTKNVNTHRTG